MEVQVEEQLECLVEEQLEEPMDTLVEEEVEQQEYPGFFQA